MEDESWLARSRILIGDGRAADEVMARMEGDVASLILDPARPRDSRQHALEEMEPGLESILSAWIPWFGQVPTAMIDLSPRLGSAQRAEAEEIVDRLLPKVARTWLWTSRGGGRVDRLMLLLGSTSVPRRAGTDTSACLGPLGTPPSISIELVRASNRKVGRASLGPVTM